MQTFDPARFEKEKVAKQVPGQARHCGLFYIAVGFTC